MWLRPDAMPSVISMLPASRLGPPCSFAAVEPCHHLADRRVRHFGMAREVLLPDRVRAGGHLGHPPARLGGRQPTLQRGAFVSRFRGPGGSGRSDRQAVRRARGRFRRPVPVGALEPHRLGRCRTDRARRGSGGLAIAGVRHRHKAHRVRGLLRRPGGRGCAPERPAGSAGPRSRRASPPPPAGSSS